MTTLSLAEFKADLQQMKDALGTARHETGQIDQYLNSLAKEFQSVSSTWHSPSSATYENVQRWFNKAAADLRDLLVDASGRLDGAIQNYENAEMANFNNVS